MPRSRWEDNIRMSIKEIAINTRNWIHSNHDKGLLETPSEFGIEPRGAISHEIN